MSERSARQLALDVLRRVDRGAFAAPSLNTALRQSTLTSQDRGFVTDLVYGTLRHSIMLDACLAPRLQNPEGLPADVRNILRLGAFEILIRETPRHAAIHSWVDVAKQTSRKLSGLVNAVLRRTEMPSDLAPATRYSVPAWLYDEWVQLFGRERAPDVAQGMSEPEPLWLTTYHPQASHLLIEEGCSVKLGPIDNTVAVRPSKPLTELEAFKRGYVQPQNPASTLPVLLLDPEPDERVLDLASGSGIKAALIAATGANVTSIELHKSKLERAEQNLKRLGLKAETFQHDLRHLPSVAPASKVLLDAPCTGTGTLRGNPEIRTRVTPETVTELADLQTQLLNTAARLTAPGGLLVYAVCALTQAEGSGMTDRFLETHPEFTPEPFIIDLPAANTPTGSYILPLDGLDGFYIARLRRHD